MERFKENENLMKKSLLQAAKSHISHEKNKNRNLARKEQEFQELVCSFSILNLNEKSTEPHSLAASPK
jgi:hypothetical protein